MSQISINSVFHPDFTLGIDEWTKWRLAYEGGRNFVNTYLVPLSARETPADLAARKKIAYVPKFATAALNEIKDSIHQRMSEVVRAGGPTSYQKACEGQLGGVDMCGNSMNTFMGTEVLREMLVMKRVGVLIDAPRYNGRTLLDKGDNHPYLSLYHTECIQSWNWRYENNVKYLSSILLNEQYNDVNDYDLPSGRKMRYRLMQKTDKGVLVKFFEPVYDETKGTTTYPQSDEVLLDLPKIPFVIFNIPISLMQDVADYQIALMNQESSDIAFILKSNYPFFYEFYDPKSEGTNYKPPGVPNSTGTAQEATAKNIEVQTGASQGRRYPKGVEVPGFTNPNPETLVVSMKKGEQLKDDIYRLVNLNLHNAARSAESKRESQRTLESQLSFLGFVLQRGETEIGEIWSHFEGSTDYPTINYPENYSLKTAEERQEEADNLSKAKNDTPSVTYKRAIARKIAQLRIGADVSIKEWEKIEKELESAECFISDVDQLVALHEAGLIDDKTAAVAAGLDEKVVEQARKDRAERIKLTLEAQGGIEAVAGAARGAPEFGGKTGAEEKDGKPKRGEGKATNKGVNE
jgi:hypothetical protein